MDYEIKVAVSELGNRVVMIVDGDVVETELSENETLVPLENYNDFVKPLWNGSTWLESATLEEIETCREHLY